jgi:hypothetical protein
VIGDRECDEVCKSRGATWARYPASKANSLSFSVVIVSVGKKTSIATSESVMLLAVTLSIASSREALSFDDDRRKIGAL